jgi:hypothetical protein
MPPASVDACLSDALPVAGPTALAPAAPTSNGPTFACIHAHSDTSTHLHSHSTLACLRPPFPPADNILGQAGPIVSRKDGSALAISGIMEFDSCRFSHSDSRRRVGHLARRACRRALPQCLVARRARPRVFARRRHNSSAGARGAALAWLAATAARAGWVGVAPQRPRHPPPPPLSPQLTTRPIPTQTIGG